MTHYNKHYVGESEADACAMRDIADYLTKKQWDAIIAVAQDPKTTCQRIDFYLSFMGVNGFPNHAFIRTFRPEQYDGWFDSLED